MLLWLGFLLLVIGGLIVLAERLHAPLGRLPGDIVWRGKNSAFYFPLTTCILLSALLSLLFYVFSRWRH